MLDKKTKKISSKIKKVVMNDVSLTDSENTTFEFHKKCNCLCTVKLIDLGVLAAAAAQS